MPGFKKKKKSSHNNDEWSEKSSLIKVHKVHKPSFRRGHALEKSIVMTMDKRLHVRRELDLDSEGLGSNFDSSICYLCALEQDT